MADYKYPNGLRSTNGKGISICAEEDQVTVTSAGIFSTYNKEESLKLLRDNFTQEELAEPPLPTYWEQFEAMGIGTVFSQTPDSTKMIKVSNFNFYNPEFGRGVVTPFDGYFTKDYRGSEFVIHPHGGN